MNKKRLQDELSKYSGFLAKNNIKVLVNESMEELKSASFPGIITNNDSPTIKALLLISNDKDLLKSSSSLVSIVMECVLVKFIQGSAVLSALKVIKSFGMNSNITNSLKIVQFAATVMPDHYFDVSIVSSLFSIALSYISHPVSLVSTTAFASFQQMFSVLVDLVLNNIGTKPDDLSKILDKMGVKCFEHIIYGIPFIILKDLYFLVIGGSTEFLSVRGISQSDLYQIWNVIISSHSSFIKPHQSLVNIVESSILLPMTDPSSLPIYITLITKYYDVAPQTSAAVFSFFLSCCNSKNSNLSYSLIFFRSIFCGRILQEFISFCNPDGSLIAALFEVLIIIADSNLDSSLVDINIELSKENSSLPKLYNQLALKSISLEICVMFVNSLPTKGISVEIIESISDQILELLLKAMRFSSLPSFKDVVDSLVKLLRVLQANAIDRKRSLIISILASFMKQQKDLHKDPSKIEITANILLHRNKKGFLLPQKRQITINMITQILYSTPLLFYPYYSRLFSVLSSSTEIDPQFTTRLDIEALIQICQSLCTSDHHSIRTLINVLITNKEKFPQVWNNISTQLLSSYEKSDSEYCSSIVELLSKVCAVCFSQETEDSILRFICSITQKHRLDDSSNYKLIEVISMIMQSYSKQIYKGWVYLIKVLSPEHCSSKSTMSLSFASFCFIVKNNINAIDDLMSIISTIFEYVSQSIDMNISLSSLELLWIVLPKMNHSQSFWKTIFDQSLFFINDQRTDVSGSALDTIFSLLSSSFEDIPNDIFEFLILNSFLNLLNSLCVFETSTLWTVQQRTLLQICHCCIVFWHKFIHIQQFIDTLWTLLIEKHKLFNMACKDDEINVLSMQFFEEAFGFGHIPSNIYLLLSSTFLSIVQGFVKRSPPDSLIMQVIGRYFAKFYTLCSSRIDYKEWLEAAKTIILSLPSEKTLHLSTSKAINVISNILTEQKDDSPLIYGVVSDILSHTQYSTVSIAIMDILDTIYPGIGMENQCCFISIFSKHFEIPQSDKLLQAILSNETISNSNDFDQIYQSLSNVSRNRESVSEFLFNNIIFLSKEGLKPYIQTKKSEKQYLFSLWAKFCDPRSKDYNQRFSYDVMDTLIDLIIEILHNDTDIESTLKQLSEIRSPPKTVLSNGQCTTWHIARFVPIILLELGNNNNLTIYSQKLLALLYSDTKE